MSVKLPTLKCQNTIFQISLKNFLCLTKNICILFLVTKGVPNILFILDLICSNIAFFLLPADLGEDEFGVIVSLDAVASWGRKLLNGNMQRKRN